MKPLVSLSASPKPFLDRVFGTVRFNIDSDHLKRVLSERKRRHETYIQNLKIKQNECVQIDHTAMP